MLLTYFNIGAGYGILKENVIVFSQKINALPLPSKPEHNDGHLTSSSGYTMQTSIWG